MWLLIDVTDVTDVTDVADVEIDVVILGGGSAGLWLLDRLHTAGYSAVLFDSGGLGEGQTLCAQGIIHGGLKYALDGVAGADAKTLASMPGVWRDCLAGDGQVDLRGCEVLSDKLYLWSGQDLPARLATLLASKLLETDSRRISPAQGAGIFQHPDFRGALVELGDFVIDPAALVRLLAERHAGRIFAIDWNSSTLKVEDGQAGLQLPGITVNPACLLLSAGTGNRDLLNRLGSTTPAMQTRPLAQVLVRHQGEQPLFGHCLGAGSSPRLTVTSHRRTDGDTVWYLGGELASNGTEMGAEQLIEHARSELAATLPWLDLASTEWRTLQVDRAEPLQASGNKPASSFLGRPQSLDNTLVVWPTKLTLCPQLGDQVVSTLQSTGLSPSRPAELSDFSHLDKPAIGQPPWERLFS